MTKRKRKADTRTDTRNEIEAFTVMISMPSDGASSLTTATRSTASSSTTATQSTASELHIASVVEWNIEEDRVSAVNSLATSVTQEAPSHGPTLSKDHDQSQAFESFMESNSFNDAIDMQLPHNYPKPEDSNGHKTSSAKPNPIHPWVKEINNFLQEFIQLDGRGECRTQEKCSRCLRGEPQYCCRDCLGGTLLCQTCVVEYHIHNPFHHVEHWNGAFFKRITLKSLGLRIQLGHSGSAACPAPLRAAADSFVVIDSHGLHDVGLDFCGCGTQGSMTQQLLRYRLYPATVQNPTTAATFRALHHFQLLSFESKCSVYEYHQALVQESDNTGLTGVKDRYKELLRMMHEWRHLKMLKRSGYGHLTNSVAMQSHSCALLCPACPQPSINLPQGWEDAPKTESWLYTLFLALDANFRMGRKGVSTKERDPCLTQGRGYFVEDEGFMAHLNSHKGQRQEPSTCVSHDAVNSADSRDTQGLAVMGIGTVDCAWHDMKRPNGVGDLQKGERYINMDYYFYSSLRTTSVKSMVVSYDIACQWSKKFYARMRASFPESWAINRSGVDIRFLVPKFHLPAHIEKCHQDYSFNYTKNVGRTDGEAPERGWSNINGLAYSTREMGPGSRQDTIEDHFSDWNWKKIVRMGPSLLGKIREAITVKVEQCERWQQLSSVVDPQQVSIWLAEVEAWEDDPCQSNPFSPRSADLTQADVRLRLAQQDASDLQTKQVWVQDDIGPSAMIHVGLELEESRRKLQAEEKSLGMHTTALQRARIQEKKNTLTRKLMSWQEVQRLYIPRISALQTLDQDDDSFNLLDISSDDFQVLLPSTIGQKILWDKQLGEHEWLLREAQARDSLNGIRQNLHLRAFLWKKKKDWARGIRQNTRSQAVINQATDKIISFATKYRVARTALSQLAPLLGKEDKWSRNFLILRDDDIKGLPADGLGEGQRALSWIWTSQGNENSQPQLIDALRIQWCRSQARALRWSEEVLLLQEEMRRVLSYLSWHADWWTARTELAWQCQNSHLLEGLVAYALGQAQLRTSLRDNFAALWCEVPTWVKVDEVPEEHVEQEV